SMVWGSVHAGDALNVVPAVGELSGTLRMLDTATWYESEQLMRALVRDIVAPYGVRAEVEYTRGVPPVVNDPHATAVLRQTVAATLEPAAVAPTWQSLGGEDFGWYLESIP